MVRSKIESTINQAQAGSALVQIVADQSDLSVDAARDLVLRGAVWIDRQRVQELDARPAAGSQIVIHFPPSGAYDAVAITPADILWEDAWLLAINKRPGWYANYTPWDVRGTLPFALAAFLRARDGYDVPLHLAHQLDRDTSGVLLVSKDPAINPAIQQLFLNGGMSKTYLALATGSIERDAFEVETGHGRGRAGLFRVYPLAEVGRKLPFGAQRVRAMHTRFEVVARGQNATFMRALPVTGRTHQIRLHLAHIGHPVVGDTRYAGPATLGDLLIPHHLLHAARLAFNHPITGESIRLTAPLPPFWTRALLEAGLAPSALDNDRY